MTPPDQRGDHSGVGDAHPERLTAPDVGLVVVRGASIRALGYGIGLALSALGSVFMLRYFSVEDFGRYMTVAALVAIVSGISEAGMSTVGAREIATRATPNARKHLISNLLGLRLVLTTLGVMAAVLFADAAGYDGALVVGTALMGIGLILMSAQLTVALPLSAELAMGRLSAAELIKQAATVAGIACLVAVGAGLVAFFSVQVFVAIAALIATRWLLAGFSSSWRPAFDRSEWRSLARMALPLAISATIAVLYFRVLVVLSSIVSTPYETGLLATSFRIVELLYGLGAVAASVALPVLSASASNRARLTYMTQRMTEVALLTSCYLSILVAALAAPILGLLGGSEYEAAAPVLQIQVFALIPSFLSQAWLMALVAAGRLNSLAIASTVGLAITGGLGTVLLRADGASGGAIAALAGELALAAVLLIMLVFGHPALRIRLGVVWKAACASIGLALVVTLSTSPWLDGLAGTATFAAIAVVTRAIPSELLDAFRERHRPTAR